MNIISTITDRLAGIISDNSSPIHPHFHLIRGTSTPHLFLPNGSKLVPIDEMTEAILLQLNDLKDQHSIEYQLALLGLDPIPFIDDQPLVNPPIHALSLSIVQKCNMGCTYCYAEQGSFGSSPKKMTRETAISAVELLLKDKLPGDKIQLTFLGGEPLINRSDIYYITEYAHQKAAEKEVDIQFSLTTNGTLINSDDIVFLEKYGFSVTISLDGTKQVHDRLRPMKSGKGSYDAIIQRIEPLLREQKKMQVSARVTVTPDNMNLAETLEEFIELGFHSVGFSPLLKSINGKKEMSPEDLNQLLEQMILCGLQFEKAVLQGKRYPFLNMINAYKEIEKRTHRPYPCGAGAGYFGVSADGELSACHRFVEDDRGKMGHLSSGVDASLQNTWLAERHVHQQSPCNQCWARYLCGGGCHHEVIDRGRPACDYIRGWLYFAIDSYTRMNRLAPHWNA